MVFNDLGLTLNEGKTHVVDAHQEMVQFLGFSIGIKRGLKTGNRYYYDSSGLYEVPTKAPWVNASGRR